MNLHIPDVRTLEVHPTPWRNLRSTCRPSSGSEERSDLGVPLLLDAISDAAELGYNFLNVAGEEPLRYTGLPAICREAHRRGMLTSMIVHSTAPSAAQLDWLRFSIDLLGIGIDARAIRPNRTRRSRAAGRLEDTLESVRRSGIPFALVFSLTSETLRDLEWTAEFANSRGAAMLQIRPAPGLTTEEMATAWMLIECLCDLHRGKLALHLDALSRYNLPLEVEDLDSWRKDVEREARYLGEVISPLVIEDTGDVVPMRYGFPSPYRFGNLHSERLRDLTNRWIETRAHSFCAAYGRALGKARESDRMFGDLREMLAGEAQGGAQGVKAACG